MDLTILLVEIGDGSILLATKEIVARFLSTWKFEGLKALGGDGTNIRALTPIRVIRGDTCLMAFYK